MEISSKRFVWQILNILDTSNSSLPLFFTVYKNCTIISYSLTGKALKWRWTAFTSASFEPLFTCSRSLNTFWYRLSVAIGSVLALNNYLFLRILFNIPCIFTGIDSRAAPFSGRSVEDLFWRDPDLSKGSWTASDSFCLGRGGIVDCLKLRC